MKLKPCPFCGCQAKAEPFVEDRFSQHFNPARVICLNHKCGATIEKISLETYKENLEDVVQRWNQRQKPKSKSNDIRKQIQSK